MGLDESNIIQCIKTVHTIPHSFTFIGLLDAFSKLRKATINFMSVCLSVRPSVWNNSTPTGRTSMKLYMWAFFEKNCRGNSSFIKIGQEQRVLYMTTTRHFRSYLAHFFLECETFHVKVVEEIKHTFRGQKLFFRKSCHLRDNVEKYCSAGQAADDKMAHAHCMLDN